MNNQVPLAQLLALKIKRCDLLMAAIDVKPLIDAETDTYLHMLTLREKVRLTGQLADISPVEHPETRIETATPGSHE